MQDAERDHVTTLVLALDKLNAVGVRLTLNKKDQKALDGCVAAALLIERAIEDAVGHYAFLHIVAVLWRKHSFLITNANKSKKREAKR